MAQSPEVLSDLRQVAVVESTESSNRLEGVVVAAHRLKSLVLKNATPQSRSEQEVAGYRDALGLIHESGEQMPFSEGTVLQLHGMLYRYMPQPGGHWKATNNDIVERHPDGSSRIRFRPVAAHHAHRDGGPDRALPLGLGSALWQTLGAGAAGHPRLPVHPPFPDGNGRMARLLTLQLLYHFDYAVGRFISLERIFEESKELLRWRPAPRAGTRPHTTSPPWLDYSGALSCVPTRNLKSAWAPSSAAGRQGRPRSL